VETVSSAWNKRKFLAGIFCDLAKAFDCVNHELLICKSHFYFIRGILLDWFRSYLYNRKQRVKLKFSSAKTDLSSWKIITCGVPQGSVLGPLLFNAYINDFPGPIDMYPSIVMFADDTILMSNDKYDELNQNFNSLLIQVSKWFQANQLVLNVGKPTVFKFTSSKSTFYPLNLFYANHSLTEAATIKFLGLQLDSQLTWRAHTNFLLNKLSSVCYIMRRLVHILNLKT
jgi:hypothetical protein